MPDLALQWRSFLLPKDGHALDECEDAVAGDPRTGRFAIADGAAESYASGDWARRLVGTFVVDGPNDNWLSAPRQAWQRDAINSASSWYAQEKLSGGSHATFLGLSILVESGDLEWSAIATGDSCLFAISHGAIIGTFPMRHSSEFSATPSFVTSLGAAPTWKQHRTAFCPGDVLLLATDALARCLLESAETGAFVGGDLIDMRADDLALWVAASRATGSLKNDDVALGIVMFEDR